MPQDPDEIWSLIDAQLRRSVGESAYANWLEPLSLVAFDSDALTLAAPPPTLRWVRDRYVRVLETAAASVLGQPIRVVVIGTDDQPPSPAQTPPAIDPAPPRQRFNPKYTFDQFILGDSNQLAHSAALAVAELPGQAYNPLFIYGPPGVGKTHLLHAIANYVQRCSPDLGAHYATVEEFTNDFLSALGHGGIERFKSRYRASDVLLIDDVQFLAGTRKPKTEEELFHTFNALYETGSQLVVTSDRVPNDLATIEDRLRARFESGLVADISPPDYAVRLAILRQRAHHDEIAVVDDGALELIAKRVTGSIRALEGALIRIVAVHSLQRRPLDLSLAAEVLDQLCPRQRPQQLSIAGVQAAVCDEFGLSTSQLISSTRAAKIAWPRQLAMYICRELGSATLPAIGAEFGGRNHATVLHACRRARARVGDDPSLPQLVERLAARATAHDADRAN